jgi:hypothetical protein
MIFYDLNCWKVIAKSKKLSQIINPPTLNITFGAGPGAGAHRVAAPTPRKPKKEAAPCGSGSATLVLEDP